MTIGGNKAEETKPEVEQSNIIGDEAPKAEDDAVKDTDNETGEKTPEKKEKGGKKEKAEKKTGEVELIDSEAAICKLYPEYKELYFNGKGGVFAPDTTPKVILAQCHLVKNPYFKG